MNEQEAAEKVVGNMAEVGEAFMYGLSQGMDQKELCDSMRDALIERGFPAVKAANLVRLVIEVASRKYLGKSHYGDENVGRLVELAF
jgi:hypothetical protein